MTTDAPPSSLWLSDVHAGLTRTRVARLAVPRSLDELRAVVDEAARAGRAVSVSGGRHAMGGQPFGTDAVHVDASRLERVLALDRERGVVEVEAGIQWPALVRALAELQRGCARPWVIAQKQTGADRLSLGGALASNVHGRGLDMRPFVSDVESFRLVDAEGRVRACSRESEPDLFALAAGGYGLFGPVHSLWLRLVRRTTVRRDVALADVDDLAGLFDERLAAGYRYGDFQFAIDPASETFLRRGILACYLPLEGDVPVPAGQRELSADDWRELLLLAHTRKSEAFERYCAHYLATDGQLYGSDTHQLGVYLDGYHHELDLRLGARAAGSELIGEVYVPRTRLAGLLGLLREDFRRHRVEPIYGTVRLVRRDAESFLAWARDDWACVVLNLHFDHTPAGKARVAADFRRVYDRALEQGGSFYLTYHRFATREQIEAAHPRFRAFLERKLAFDPEERFQSDWYRHHRDLFLGGGR
jgi:FAD/FMN-containing dehydrogenase